MLADTPIVQRVRLLHRDVKEDTNRNNTPLTVNRSTALFWIMYGMNIEYKGESKDFPFLG